MTERFSETFVSADMHGVTFIEGRSVTCHRLTNLKYYEYGPNPIPL